MSEIELGENSDRQKSDAWLMRARDARPDHSWICKITNQVQNDWSSMSDSGHFNSLVWSRSKMLEVGLN